MNFFKLLPGMLLGLLFSVLPADASIFFSRGNLVFSDDDTRIEMRVPYDEAQSEWWEMEEQTSDRFAITTGNSSYTIEYLRLVRENFSPSQICSNHEDDPDIFCIVVDEYTYLFYIKDTRDDIRYLNVTRQIETGETIQIILEKSGAFPTQEELEADIDAIASVVNSVQLYLY